MTPLWINALYLLLGGLAALAVIGWIYEEFEHRRPQAHGSHPKPMEPSNRCARCFGPVVTGPPPGATCSYGHCATWDRPKSPNYIVSQPHTGPSQ